MTMARGQLPLIVRYTYREVPTQHSVRALSFAKQEHRIITLTTIPHALIHTLHSTSLVVLLLSLFSTSACASFAPLIAPSGPLTLLRSWGASSLYSAAATGYDDPIYIMTLKVTSYLYGVDREKESE